MGVVDRLVLRDIDWERIWTKPLPPAVANRQLIDRARHPCHKSPAREWEKEKMRRRLVIAPTYYVTAAALMSNFICTVAPAPD